MKLGLVYGKVFLQHSVSILRPWMEAFESPLRYECVIRHLNTKGILSNNRIIRIPPERATFDSIRKVHSSYLVDIVRILSTFGKGVVGHCSHVSDHLSNVTLYACGSAIRAGNAVFRKEVDMAFALIRPPGHHASRSHAEGLCYFNNVAVLASHLKEEHGVERILIVCLLYTSPSPRDLSTSRMPSSA